MLNPHRAVADESKCSGGYSAAHIDMCLWWTENPGLNPDQIVIVIRRDHSEVSTPVEDVHVVACIGHYM